MRRNKINNTSLFTTESNDKFTNRIKTQSKRALAINHIAF